MVVSWITCSRLVFTLHPERPSCAVCLRMVRCGADSRTRLNGEVIDTRTLDRGETVRRSSRLREALGVPQS